ncbi:hypothetical protein HBH56_115790 [Parastagonospora nodorum]|uniref:F-box domain-containing protein n=2 Tax=Phaeosphaeria nodorum (strain SN15 / ATCC MYA-4574 / FGSC 10173) TaxID=321614 RepID=A0A7U2FIL2_PHANO|nr:hypothetical protein SNOG_10988 [Parastagonospora nodorum SN15]KAH3912493.1 hypothetical protein HBH56_115790 [Parastagonospora nodorum]EAT81487.1 hypothetical protein SNOG_10988 [Parastagonospora nodorum SN15]KAH3928868.1 hypothetical protein HBH54_133360 [Parastagonospora nodorum]KAH4136581.1 hypothetical protein HBH45_131550 [Parastagonospora nodorum]KAH4160765.1 hypothetical protein HBH44_100710 [Parastagonospora nodorum]
MAEFHLRQFMRLISLSDKRTETEKHISRDPDMARARIQTEKNNLPIEMLQHILSYLDCIALLRCRCACARWLDCILGDSGDLRNIMFLPKRIAAKTNKGQSYNLTITFYTDAKNPYRQLRSSTVGIISQILMVSTSPGDADSAISLHPFMLKSSYMKAHIPKGLIKAPSRSLHFLSLWNRADYRLVHPGDSELWKHFLVTTPASTEVRVKYRYIDQENYPLESEDGQGSEVLRNVVGVRFCEVFDAIEAKAMGLLRRAALKQFDENPQACLEFPGLH